jgi:UDP-2-acetamido-3-amino-2,3-dideoxy-glucuronate N-acetyltransferase
MFNSEYKTANSDNVPPCGPVIFCGRGCATRLVRKWCAGARRPFEVLYNTNQERKSMPIADSVRLGENVKIFHPALVNLYGCTVGSDTRIGAFVEIQKNATIGARCKISSHTFICEGVVIEDEVFVGHGVMFTNDRFPRATNPDGSPQSEADWSVEPTRVGRTASIGSNATILCGLTIGEGALVGAGAVVTADVAPYAIVAGVPARVIGQRERK